MSDKLKILYISHYYPPEVNAPALRVSEMASRWAEKGHTPTILTGFPNHPNGIIPEKYRGMIKTRENGGKIDVIRTYLYATPNKGFLKRILNYLSFMFSSILLGSSSVGKPDILIATSPQFFVAVAGYVISRIKRCKFIFEVRDIWPEEIVAVGAVKNRFIIGALERLELFLYRKADLVCAVAQGTIDDLVQRGVPREKMALIPNGVNIEHFQSDDDGSEVRQKLGLLNKFIVSYLGTHGMAHKLETVLEAAELLKESEDIHFLFVGDGAEKTRLVSLASKMALPNVTFHGQILRDQIPAFYQAIDLFLAPLQKADLFTKNVPSKLYEIMAAHKPVIIGTNGESRRLVESAGAGIGATPEDAKDLAEKILILYNDPEKRVKMGQDGYAFALANASRKLLADLYLKILQAVVAGHTYPEEYAASLTGESQSAGIAVKNEPEVQATPEGTRPERVAV